MRVVAVSLALSALASAGDVVRLLPYRQSEFAEPGRWQPWAPRPEIAPVTSIARDVSRGGAPGALRIHGGGNAAASGGWHLTAPEVEPGKWYRLSAWYRAEGVPEEANQVVLRLGWAAAEGKAAGRPEYAWETASHNGWKRLSVAAPAPPNARAAAVDLWLNNAPGGTVYWDDISLEETSAPPPRTVRTVAIRYRPARSSGTEQNLREFAQVAARHAKGAADLLVFPEGMTVAGTTNTYIEVSESVPGPTTAALGEIARAHNAWVVGGLYEREGKAVYNTAVLIDRQGRYAGKYRKVYLPREEVEAGLTPGDSYPVFTTDFGRLGIMICWDVQYADPARALALAGAEIVALPIWGRQSHADKSASHRKQHRRGHLGLRHCLNDRRSDG